MRSIFYVALAVAVLARSSVVAAFTNADESQLLSKTTPDFAADAMISSDSRKRFLRVTDPEDGDVIAADEERTNYDNLSKIIRKLDNHDKAEMKKAATILKNMPQIENKNMLKAARESNLNTKKEHEALKALFQGPNLTTTHNSCDLVASSGDDSAGIRVVTDSTCSAGGIGCINDVCRFCKVITSVQSAAFIDCATINGYTPETEAPTASTPDVTTTSPASTTTCAQVASDGDRAVGVDITTDTSCSSGGVGCIDNVCRFCQVTATVQSAAFVNCTTLPDYTPRLETPVDTATTTPSASNAPVAQPSCGLVVSAGDAAVGISITGDATCAAGGVGCIDSVCRFCKVTTTVQSAAFMDCTAITGFTVALNAPVDTTVPSTVSTTVTPTTLTPAAACSLVVSEGDAAVGINITADSTCQFGGVGCIDNVCRFCKVRATAQSAAFVDCPVTTEPTGSATGSSAPADVPTDAPSGDVVSTTEAPDSNSTTGSSVATSDSGATANDTNAATDIPGTSTDATDAPSTTAGAVDNTGSGSDKSTVTEAPPADTTEPTDTTTDVPSATSGTSTSTTTSSDGGNDVAPTETPGVDTTEPTGSTNDTTNSTIDGSKVGANGTVTEAPAVVDTSDLLTEAPTKPPTKASVPVIDDHDDWSDTGSEADSDSTYHDSNDSLL